MGKKIDAALDEAYSKLGEIVLSGALVEKTASHIRISPRGRIKSFRKPVIRAYLGPTIGDKNRWMAEWWSGGSAPIMNYGTVEELIEWLRPLIKQKMK